MGNTCIYLHVLSASKSADVTHILVSWEVWTFMGVASSGKCVGRRQLCCVEPPSFSLTGICCNAKVRAFSYESCMMSDTCFQYRRKSQVFNFPEHVQITKLSLLHPTQSNSIFYLSIKFNTSPTRTLVNSFSTYSYSIRRARVTQNNHKEGSLNLIFHFIDSF